MADLTKHGILARKDLTVGRLADGAALDMGTPFDFFGEESRCRFVTSSRSLPEAEPGIP